MMKRCSCALLSFIAAGLIATNALAALTFSDDFTGGASSHWANATVADYTNDNAAFNGSGDAGRIYLYTADFDYAAEDFVATVDLTNKANGSGSVFFGLGEGTPNGTYSEPTNGSYIFLRYNGSDWITTLVNVSNDVEPEAGFGDNFPSDTTVRFMYDWDASESTATLSVDGDLDGIYDGAFVFTNSNLSATGATTRLFFGGADGVTADNFSVTVGAVPEPSALVLLTAGLFGLGIAVWRRKR